MECKPHTNADLGKLAVLVVSTVAASAQLWAVAHKRAEPIATVSKHSKELKALHFGEENALITLLEGAEQLDEDRI